MKNKKTFGIITILFICICIFKGFTALPDVTAPKFVLLQSDYESNDSNILTYDANKNLLNESNFPIIGLDSFYYSNGKITSYSSYDSKVATINLAGNFKQNFADSKYPHPLLSLHSLQGHAIIYNYDAKKDMDFYTYDFSSEETGFKNKKERHLGIPFVSALIDDQLLVYLRDLNKPLDNQFTLKKISLKSNTPDKTVQISNNVVAVAPPAEKNEHYYVLGEDFSNQNNMMVVTDKSLDTVTYNPLPTKFANSFYLENKHISLFTHSDNGFDLNIFDYSFNLIDTITFANKQLIKTKRINNQLYVLYKDGQDYHLGHLEESAKLISILKINKPLKDFIVL